MSSSAPAMRIDGKLAVVTGAAVGTGRAIAERLAAEGAEVVLADIDADGGRQTRELIGGSARFVHAERPPELVPDPG